MKTETILTLFMGIFIGISLLSYFTSPSLKNLFCSVYLLWLLVDMIWHQKILNLKNYNDKTKRTNKETSA